MKLGEKITFKLRNYLYQIERNQTYKNLNKMTHKEESNQDTKQIGSFLKDIDEYLEEIFDEVSHKNKK